MSILFGGGVRFDERMLRMTLLCLVDPVREFKKEGDSTLVWGEAIRLSNV